MRAAIWLRVSRDDKGQDAELQRAPVELLCKNRSWEIVKVYLVEESAFVTEQRHLFYGMIADAKRGEFDVIVAWSMDRFSREGPQTMFKIIIDLIDAKVGFCSVSEPFLDTTSGPFAYAMIPFFSWIARLSSETKSKAIKLGIEKAKKYGTKKGGPIGRVPSPATSAVIDAYQKVRSVRAAARIAGCKPGTAHGILCKAGLIPVRKTPPPKVDAHITSNVG